jgi:hypothetical protein
MKGGINPDGFPETRIRFVDAPCSCQRDSEKSERVNVPWRPLDYRGG